MPIPALARAEMIILPKLSPPSASVGAGHKLAHALAVMTHDFARDSLGGGSRISWAPRGPASAEAFIGQSYSQAAAHEA